MIKNDRTFIVAVARGEAIGRFAERSILDPYRRAKKAGDIEKISRELKFKAFAKFPELSNKAISEKLGLDHKKVARWFAVDHLAEKYHEQVKAMLDQ